MLELRFEHYRIEISDDPTFRIGSADNTVNYDSVYGNDDDYYSTKLGIFVFEDKRLLRSSLICAGGGATGASEDSAAVLNSTVYVCAGQKLFSLTLPGLKLGWARMANHACCFGVFPYEQDLIVHGELAVSRIDIDGKIKWSAGFSDITVTPDGESSFQMNRDHIEVLDWSKNRYRVDYQTGRSTLMGSWSRKFSS